MRRRLMLAAMALLALLVGNAVGASIAAGSGPVTSGSQVATTDVDADYVIIAGAAGLRWDDIDAERTPTMWRLAERGSIGTLSVRSAAQPTCPADGWLTLGAGNYAARTPTPVDSRCPPMDVSVERANAVRADLPDQEAVVARQQRLPYGAVPGALAEQVRCTTAVGLGAAIAAARPFGKIDRYAEQLPEDPTKLLSACVLSAVDLGTITAEEPERRRRQVAQVDALLAKVVATRPSRSTIVVAGLADTDTTARLHAVVVDGPGWDKGWLTSAKTNRAGYVELVDLAPTALKVLGRTPPEKLFAGYPAVAMAGRPDDMSTATAAGADADRQAAASRTVSNWFFIALAVVQIALYAAVVPLLRRSYRHAGPTGPRAPSAPLLATVEVLLTAAALALPSALVADLVPWWRWSQRGLIFGLVTVGVLAVLTVIVTRIPGWSLTLGPVGLVAAVAAAVVGVDLLTGSRLQLNGVAGYSALEGGRYAGVGIVAMGAFIAGALLTAGCLAQLLPQARRPLLVGVLGTVSVFAVGSPYLGADAGGAVALTAGVCLAAALSTGGWLSFRRLAWATGVGAAATIGLAAVDISRPPDQRGSLGRFLAQLIDGTSSLTLNRIGAANVLAFATSPLTVLAVAGAIFVWSVLMRPWGGLKRLFGIYPAIRAAVVGITVAAPIAGTLAGAALNAIGAAVATTLPLLTLASLRGLTHAADRTRTVEQAASRPADRGPVRPSPAPEDAPGRVSDR